MHSRDTRDRVLASATTLFLAHGHEQVSMDQVRRAAGVSNGSLYHHFPTKQALADALYAQLLRDFHQQLVTVIGPRKPARSGVQGLVRAYLQWVADNPGPARLLHTLRHGDALSRGGEWAGANAEGFARLAAWITARVEAGEMRAMPLGVWLALVFAPSMALTRQWLEHPATTPPAPPPVAPAPVRAALEHAAWMAVAP